MYPRKIQKAATPETRERNKARKQLLYAALDFLDAPQDTKTERYGSPLVLYTQLQVAVLIRTLSAYMKLPKSKRRAETLGIAVDTVFVPPHERKLQRKRLSKRLSVVRRAEKLERLRERRGWDSDDGALV